MDEGLLHKMAQIFDGTELVDQIADVNRRQQLKQLEKLNDLKQQSEQYELEIQKQKQEFTKKEKELEKQYIKQQQLDDILKQYETEGKSLSEENKKFIITITQLTDKCEIAKKQYNTITQQLDKTEKEQQQLLKDLDNWNKNSKTLQSEIQKKDAKQAKLIEELAQIKVVEVKQENNEDLSKLLDKVISDNKRLLKQRAEVVNVFKKQSKIIEILRKQKLHLQTSNSLDMTEQDYAKIVDFTL